MVVVTPAVDASHLSVTVSPTKAQKSVPLGGGRANWPHLLVLPDVAPKLTVVKARESISE